MQKLLFLFLLFVQLGGTSFAPSLSPGDKDFTSFIAVEQYDISSAWKKLLAPAGNSGCPELKPAFDDPMAATMVEVEGGKFRMGSESGHSDEKPIHEVELSTFYLSRHEVTNAQYCAFLNEKGNQQEGGVEWIDLSGNWGAEKCRIEKKGSRYEVSAGYERYSVLYVSWYGAVAYCQWLSERSGKQYRLPTEAEWEYAARGGKSSRGYTYSGSNDLKQVGWYWENSGDKLLSGDWSSDKLEQNNCRSQPVGQKTANELGLYDMSGNVWEWCSDWYGGDYYQNSLSKNPQGPTSGSSRVCRGGSWSYVDSNCRSALRTDSYPTYRSYILGFRVAQDK